MKLFICESKALLEQHIDTSKYEMISIFDVPQFDKTSWINLMKTKVSTKSDKPLLIWYPEMYLNIVEQQTFLEELIKIQQREFDVFTDSPYIISDDSLEEFIYPV